MSAIRPFRSPAFIACSLIFGWVMGYFFHASPWESLAGADAQSARLYFFGGQLVGMLAALSLMRRYNVKGMVCGCAAAAAAAALALRFIPAAQAGGWGFALFGLLAGGCYGGMFYFWIFAFNGAPRVASIAAVHLAGGAVSLTVIWAGRLFGATGAAIIDIILPLIAIWAALVMDIERMDDPGQADLLAFPRRLIGVVTLAILVLYLSSFLPEGLLGSSEKGAWPVLGEETRFLASSAAYALFVIAGGGVHVLTLLYAAILLELVGFGLIMLNATVLAGPLALVLADAAGNLFLFVLTFDIFHKHRRRPMIGAIFAGAVAAGTILGMLIGSGLDDLGLSGTAAFAGLLVLFYAGILALLPPLLRVLERELFLREPTRTTRAPGIGPDGRDTDEEGPVAILDMAYIREPMIRKIRRLNEGFDPPYRLTAREIEIAALLAGRLDYKTIARRLSISINTLKVHAKSVYRKFDVLGRKGLIELCLEPNRESETSERASGA